MRHKGKVFGAVIVLSIFIYWWLVIGDIDTRHLWFLFLFGTIGFVLGKRYDRAIHNANKDELTHTYNRKFAHALFPKMLASADRRKTTLVVFLVDLDRLKYVNDTFGHQAGDDAILHTAATLERSVRSADIVARWGGDEFLILAPDMTREQANQVRERIEMRVREIASQDGMEYGASVGFSVYPEDARTLDELIESADQRMYKVKENSYRTNSTCVGEPV